MTQLIAGTPAPMFYAESRANPRFAVSSMGGLYVLFLFAPDDEDGRRAAFGAIQANRDLFDDDNMAAFVILRDRETFSRKRHDRGLRWFLDEDGSIGALYGADQHPKWVVLDPTQRLLAFGTMDQTAQVFSILRGLPPADDHAGVEVAAPVLTVPRVLEPDLCQRLIAYYEARGGAPSGVMKQLDGKTVGVLDDHKKRRDLTIADDDLIRDLRARLKLRLLPEIAKAFQFTATRVERYIVACYDAGEGGYFRRHRDNTTTGTAHRKFAVSINLNDRFEGGDLRFPEFGRRTYRPPAGGAVVFSCSLLHEATPVTSGTRYATLPFLYDEAGQAVREANQHTLETAEA